MISGVVNIGRTYRQARRYREIAGVLARHGFGDLLRVLGLARWGGGRRRGEPVAAAGLELGPSRYQRVRLALAELGPTFVKLGQLLSTRSDIVPPGLLAELEHLQVAVPPFPGDEAIRVVEAELGGTVAALFGRFDPQPLASGSIGQVHEALTRDGARVVVKIQRPGIAELIETDVQILEILAGLLEQYVPEAKVFEPVALVREFSRLMRSELDFGTEAARIERVAMLFRDHPGLRVPQVHRELSTARVLTMEYIEGTRLAKIAELQRRGLDVKQLVATSSEVLFKQIFEHGFFHSDPHPGNLLALPDNRICFLDYGQMGSLSALQREDFAQLVFGLVRRDEHRIAEAVFRLAGYDAMENHGRVENEIRKFNEDRLYRPLKDIRIGPLLADLSRLLVRYDIHMPAEFFVVCKCLTTYDGVVRSIMPEFNAVQFAAPFARQLIGQRFGLKRLLRDLAGNAAELRHLVRRTPQELRETFSLLRRGEIKIAVAQPGFARTQNRQALALVVAAAVVASAILLHSGSGPRWQGLPVTGLVFSGLTLGASLFLLGAMLRHGKF